VSGLSWVRLDTAFPFNPKVQALLAEPGGHRAATVYLCGLSYAGLNGTDGYLPPHALPSIHGKKADATKLVEHRFWLPAEGGGWDIHDWAEKQPSTEETQKRRQRAQDAALIRWHGKKKGA
jgi:hypothetical protein